MDSILMAEGSRPETVSVIFQTIFWGALLAIVLVAGIFVIHQIRHWATGKETSDPFQKLLTDSREAYLRGDLEESEFQQIKAQLTWHIRQSVPSPMGGHSPKSGKKSSL